MMADSLKKGDALMNLYLVIPPIMTKAILILQLLKKRALTIPVPQRFVENASHKS
jgi:hypothetical protein